MTVSKGVRFKLAPPRNQRVMLLTSVEIARFAGLDGWHMIERARGTFGNFEVPRCFGVGQIPAVVARRWLADRDRPTDYLCKECCAAEPRWTDARKRNYLETRRT